MEYIIYILVIFGVMALCFVLFRGSDFSSRVENEPKRSEKAREQALEQQTTNGSTITQDVPVPWGWPGHDESTDVTHHASLNAQEVHGVSESLRRLADRLLSAKQSVEDHEYLLKKDACLRAMIEDRYGRVYKAPEVNDKTATASVLPEAGDTLGLETLREVKKPWGW